eukprot:CAMPEP_0176486458 /NCGR_PEP_ID=MMETSP0200_2-20121128/5577_1 /TAXON_ID=947934 /ORGANISM="Chaetoceros sp., Strain GSL56" /LENGTH=754 /DNA_ID=CAMNT_0017883157 /DNA_START=248 /DNA_END=2509 /DNA_ORIENTATION=-
MNRCQLRLLSFFFGALLPPRNSSRRNNSNQLEKEQQQQGGRPAASTSTSYYELLGVAPNATIEEIRKAYKKKSLQHHPDKVAQFAHNNNNNNNINRPLSLLNPGDNNDAMNVSSPDENNTFINYLRIKEAYETLSDPKKRDAYDILGEEGGKLVSSWIDSKNDNLSNDGSGGAGAAAGGGGRGVGLDFHSLVYNLTRASIVDKCKLFCLVLFMVGLVLIVPLLVSAKVDGITNDPWVIILIPLWLLNIVVLGGLAFGIGKAWFALLKFTSIFVLEILLALKWDGTIDTKYAIIFVPLYLYHLLMAVENVVIMKAATRDISRMVTLDYLEQYILPNFVSNDGDVDDNENDNNHDDEDADGEERRIAPRSYEDLTQEERDAINEIYIIVSGDDNMSPLMSVHPKVKLVYDIASSEEYQYASSVRSMAKWSMISIVFYRIPFLILLILQLDQQRGWNWNVVFVPIWVEVLTRALSSCWGVCCGSVTSMDAFETGLGQTTSRNYNGNYEDDDDEDGDDEEKGEQHLHLHQRWHEETGQQLKETECKENTPTTNVVDQTDEEVKNDEESLNNDHKDQRQQSDPDEKLLQDNDMDKSVSSDAQNNNERPDHNWDGHDHTQFDSDLAEQHAKSVGSCCYYMMVVMGLSLFVVKLNRATDVSKNDQLDYSSFWVLVPLFLMALFVLTLFGCCIFATPSKLFNQQEDGEDREHQEYNDDVHCENEEDRYDDADHQTRKEDENHNNKSHSGSIIGERDGETGHV